MAKVVHPDKGGSEEKMAAVNEAYEVLSNPGMSLPLLFLPSLTEILSQNSDNGMITATTRTTLQLSQVVIHSSKVAIRSCSSSREETGASRKARDSHTTSGVVVVKGEAGPSEVECFRRGKTALKRYAAL